MCEVLLALAVNDLYAIFDDAEAKKSRLADIGDDPVFTLHEFTTEYVAPDGTIGRGGGSAAAEVPSFPGMPGGRGNDAGAAASCARVGRDGRETPCAGRVGSPTGRRRSRSCDVVDAAVLAAD